MILSNRDTYIPNISAFEYATKKGSNRATSPELHSIRTTAIQIKTAALYAAVQSIMPCSFELLTSTEPSSLFLIYQNIIIPLILSGHCFAVIRLQRFASLCYDAKVGFIFDKTNCF